MDFNEKSIKELLQGLEGEIAKTISEIAHAQQDLEKAQNRQKFTLALIHHLKTRYGDMK
jgi:hypothetical protein